MGYVGFNAWLSITGFDVGFGDSTQNYSDQDTSSAPTTSAA
jgi:hypothetical protein